MLKEFQKFLLRGNLVELAIGFTVGAAFSTLAKSLVDDIIMPPIAALLGNVDFTNLRIILKSSSQGTISLNYGRFINNLLALMIVGVAMFLVIKMVNQLDDRLEGLIKKNNAKEKQEPANKKCPYCFSIISYRATRCPSCTSHFQLEQQKKS